MLAGRRTSSSRKPDDGNEGNEHRKQQGTSRPVVGHPRDAVQARPSDHWSKDFALPPDDVERVISGANWAYLTDEAAKHHPGRRRVTCTADLDKWTRGVFNAIFELAFSDGVVWVARIRLGVGGGGGKHGWDPDADDNSELRAEMLSEIATMRMVQARTSIPVPTVFAYNVGTTRRDNAFGYPYMLLSALPGRVLSDRLRLAGPVPVADFVERKLAGQLARLVWELSQIAFDQIGRVWCGRGLDEPAKIVAFPMLDDDDLAGPFNSSSAYLFAFRREVDGKTRDRFFGDDKRWPQWAAACTLLRRAVPMLVCPQFRRGPFPLYHHDLHAHNVLVDDEYNITGVLDWTGVCTAPVELFVAYAHRMSAQMLSDLSDAENQPVAGFRKHFIAAYRRLEEEEEKETRTKTETASALAAVAAQDSDVRRSDCTATAKTRLSLSYLFASPLPEAVYRWDTRVLYHLAATRRDCLSLVRLLYGSDTTLDNYDARRKKGFGRSFRSALSPVAPADPRLRP